MSASRCRPDRAEAVAGTAAAEAEAGAAAVPGPGRATVTVAAAGAATAAGGAALPPTTGPSPGADPGMINFKKHYFDIKGYFSWQIN